MRRLSIVPNTICHPTLTYYKHSSCKKKIKRAIEEYGQKMARYRPSSNHPNLKE
jgi:hypothetical protein